MPALLWCALRPPVAAQPSKRLLRFNNLGVAAQYALSRHGLERILIVDWDIHHGNGIQQLFYEKKEVLYFSSHVLGWFPRTGHSNETGEGEGTGYTINVELPRDIEDGEISWRSTGASLSR